MAPAPVATGTLEVSLAEPPPFEPVVPPVSELPLVEPVVLVVPDDPDVLDVLDVLGLLAVPPPPPQPARTHSINEDSTAVRRPKEAAVMRCEGRRGFEAIMKLLDERVRIRATAHSELVC